MYTVNTQCDITTDRTYRYESIDGFISGNMLVIFMRFEICPCEQRMQASKVAFAAPS